MVLNSHAWIPRVKVMSIWVLWYMSAKVVIFVWRVPLSAAAVLLLLRLILGVCLLFTISPTIWVRLVS